MNSLFSLDQGAHERQRNLLADAGKILENSHIRLVYFRTICYDQFVADIQSVTSVRILSGIRIDGTGKVRDAASRREITFCFPVA